MGYNGRSNYETWLVNLWLDNEQGSKDFMWEWLEYHLARQTCGQLSRYLKETYEEDVDTLSLPPFWNDLLRGALSEVNWMEIASHIWEEWEERKERKQKEND